MGVLFIVAAAVVAAVAADVAAAADVGSSMRNILAAAQFSKQINK